MNSAPVTTHGDRDEVEGEVRGEREPLVRERGGQRRALNQRDQQRAVARVLRDLAATGLAFFAQLLQRRMHHRQQVHDDARRDVRHDAERKDTHAVQRAAREHVEQVENAALILFEQLPQPFRIDTRDGNVASHARNQERNEDEQQTVAELREPRLNACQFLPLSGHQSSTLPPAASIAARAPLVSLMPLTVTALSIVPDSMMRARFAPLLTRLAAFSASRSTTPSADFRQFAETNFSRYQCNARPETELRHTALQRHLTALETGLRVAALARLLTFVAATARLAETRADAAADALLDRLAAGRGRQFVQSHHCSPSTRTM